jgi:hypothetical protein
MCGRCAAAGGADGGAPGVAACACVSGAGAGAAGAGDVAAVGGVAADVAAETLDGRAPTTLSGAGI